MDSIIGSDVCQPVYEREHENGLERHLVLTPWMLMDQLLQCQEETEEALDQVYQQGLGWEERCGVPVNPLADRLEAAHFSITQTLRLLWRGGLWTDECCEDAQAVNGKRYKVLRAPFTDGKPHGRPLPIDTPDWQRELLGLSKSGKK